MYLGIDLGTSGCKAALFNGQFFLAAAEYQTFWKSGREAEQDPEEWWQSAAKAVRDVVLKAGCSAKKIQGIALSSHSPSLVPVDKKGKPLAPAVIWQDTRAEAEAEHLSKITGWRQSPASFESKVLWLKNHRPEIYRQTHVFLQPKDYLVFKLCGRFQMDSASASAWFCFDRSNNQWFDWPEGPEIEKLTEITEPWEVIGGLTSKAAQDLALAPGTPVISGSIDAYCETLGAGAVREGQSCDITGTSTCLITCLQTEQGIREDVFKNLVPGQYLKILTMSSTGAALKWFVDTFNMQNKPFESFLAALIPSTIPGARGLIFLPYLCGERSPIWDPNARGLFFGISQHHTPADFLQATLEGVAFGIRHNLDHMEQSGVEVTQLNAVGGGARLPHWLQIKADITGKQICTLKIKEGALMGTILLAAYAVGNYKSLQEAVDELVTVDRVYSPRKEYVGIYEKQYSVYRKLYPRVKDLYVKENFG